MRGNVVDLAVGFILGGAFSTIVKSLVNDVILPPIGVLLGGDDFSKLKWVIKEADPTAEAAEVAISYGLFINSVISFLIVALSLFFLIKGMNTAMKQKEEEPEEEEATKPRGEELLEEIRDLLVKNN